MVSNRLKLLAIGAAYGFTAAAALILNLAEAYRDDLWPALLRESSVPGVIVGLIGDRPVLANATMGEGCSAAVCMRGRDAIISGITLRGPFDRDQIRVDFEEGSASVGSGAGAAVQIRGPVLLSAPERRP